MAKYNSNFDVPPNHGGLVIEPNNNDVLSGRGGRINAHPGNKQYREIVRQYRGIYHANETKKLDKSKIAAKIVEIIRNMDPPGRFLKEESNAWVEIGDEKARKKAGQAMREKDPTKPKSQEDESRITNEPTFSGEGINIPTIHTAPTAASSTSCSVNQHAMEQIRNYELSQPLNSGTHSDFHGASATYSTNDRSRSLRQKFQRETSLNSSSLWDEPQSQFTSTSRASFNDSTISIDSARRLQFRKMKHEESFSELQIPAPLSKPENQDQLDERDLMNQSLVSMEMQSIEKSTAFMSINDMIMSSLNEVVADAFESDDEEGGKETLCTAEKKKRFLASRDNSNAMNFDHQGETFHHTTKNLKSDLTESNQQKSYSDYGAW